MAGVGLAQQEIAIAAHQIQRMLLRECAQRLTDLSKPGSRVGDLIVTNPGIENITAQDQGMSLMLGGVQKLQEILDGVWIVRTQMQVRSNPDVARKRELIRQAWLFPERRPQRARLGGSPCCRCARS